MKECSSFDPERQIILHRFSRGAADYLVVQQGTILCTGVSPDSDFVQLTRPAILQEMPQDTQVGNGSIAVSIICVGRESQKIPQGIFYLPIPS